jgi:hypothetical protein
LLGVQFFFCEELEQGICKPVLISFDQQLQEAICLTNNGI